MEVLWWGVFALAAGLGIGCLALFLRLKGLEGGRERQVAQLAALQDEKAALLQKLAASEQKTADLKERLLEWETEKQNIIAAAKAASLETSRELSKQLLQDHQRTTEAAKLENEKQISKTTEQLTEQFRTITEKVAALKDSDQKQDKTLATMWRALSTPSAVGQFGELGLENYLRQLSLEPERDFIMQHSIAGEDGSRLRPDCVIPLPNNQAIVIDSKASRYVLEVAAATDETSRAQALAGLARSMNEHVRALKTKDYHSAVLSMCKKAGRLQDVSHVVYVMYLPSETAYFFLHEADRNFIPRTREEHGILIVSPTHLYTLLAAAQAEIRQARKAEHQQDIIEALPRLLEGVAGVMAPALKLGKSIQSTARHFEDFARSFNHGVLREGEKIQQLGVHHRKEKQMEGRLPRYEILSSDDTLTLEAESPAPDTPLRLKAALAENA